jgi:hypothetical protein
MDVRITCKKEKTQNIQKKYRRKYQDPGVGKEVLPLTLKVQFIKEN